jgi:hypothetical protein
MTRIVVTGNVFQPGPNHKCGLFGPAYGGNRTTSAPGTDGYRTVWPGKCGATGHRCGCGQWVTTKHLLLQGFARSKVITDFYGSLPPPAGADPV